MTDHLQFAARVMLELSYVPNRQQEAVIVALARFCCDPSCADRVFVLNGYAGTGKSSLTGALVKAMTSAGMKSVLLAPTGRAAKVFSGYAGKPAYTIHRRIYRHMPGAGFGNAPLPRDNNDTDTVFIVDEASMIGGEDERGNNLLEDLLQYVYSGQGCRLVLIGDTAQLPPVGSESSPAMDPGRLREAGLKVTRATMTETVRQQRQSGILYNATWLRRAMLSPELPEPRLFTKGFDDVSIVSGEELSDRLETAYARDGVDRTLIITRSNRTARDYNLAIRNSVLYVEDELMRGDLLIVAKNNYFWSRKVSGIDFVANGDIVRIERVYGLEVRYGFRFVDVSLSMPDRDTAFDAKIMLATLFSETAGLPREEIERLYYAMIDDPDTFAPDMPYDARLRKLRDNPYWNALQVKYAYAATCHKAQGGQWDNIFVDLGYIPPEAMGLDFYRWLYTAVTRATGHLYFINAPEGSER